MMYKNLIPAILTAMVLAIGAVFARFFEWKDVVLYLGILPVPLLLLWLSSKVESPEARIAATDAAHAGALH